MKIFVMFTFLFGLLISPCLMRAQSTNPNQNTAFTIMITSRDNVVKAGTDILVEVAVTNISDHQIAIPNFLGGAEVNFNVEVLGSDGHTAPETSYRTKLRGPRRAGGSATLDLLNPQQTLTEKMHLNSMYDLSKPGKYTVQVKTFGPDPNTKTTVNSNVLTLTVTP